jgi:hypothetical protein
MAGWVKPGLTTNKYYFVIAKNEESLFCVDFTTMKKRLG